MDQANIIMELRKSMGKNRKEFCEYFNIPYRTVTDWERGERHAPDYVIRLLSYYVKMMDKEDKGSLNNQLMEKGITDLRESTGMNRKEFCAYFDISYRTVTDWEREERHAPDYVVRLLEYKIRMDNFIKK